MATYGHTFTSGDTVTPTKLNNARTVSDIVNADIKSDAAIAGTKIAPNFGSQNIVTSGSAFLQGGGAGDQVVHIGASRSANGYAYVDLQGDTTYANGLRLIRGNSGPNTVSNIEHRGTGPLQLVTQEAAPIVFLTNTTERMRVKTTGQVRFQPLASDPSGAESGDVYYNSATNKLRVHNGTSWVDLH